MSAIDPARAPIPTHILARMSPQDRARYGAPLPGTAVPQAVTKLPDRRDDGLLDHAEERRIQGEIIGWLRLEGYEPCYARMDRKSTLPPGWPDITLATRNGRAMALEVKTPTGRTSPDQDDRITAMRAAGWTVAVVRSLAEVQDFLNQDFRP